MSLDEEDVFKFRNSQDYQEMTKLYKDKFYPDYQKYIHLYLMYYSYTHHSFSIVIYQHIPIIFL